jgi:hypothetical protein
MARNHAKTEAQAPILALPDCYPARQEHPKKKQFSPQPIDLYGAPSRT